MEKMNISKEEIDEFVGEIADLNSDITYDLLSDTTGKHLNKYAIEQIDMAMGITIIFSGSVSLASFVVAGIMALETDTSITIALTIAVIFLAIFVAMLFWNAKFEKKYGLMRTDNNQTYEDKARHTYNDVLHLNDYNMGYNEYSDEIDHLLTFAYLMNLDKQVKQIIATSKAPVFAEGLAKLYQLDEYDDDKITQIKRNYDRELAKIETQLFRLVEPKAKALLIKFINKNEVHYLPSSIKKRLADNLTDQLIDIK